MPTMMSKQRDLVREYAASIPAVAGIDAPMDAAEFSAAAEMLFGADWKPRVAVLLDVSERSVKRWAAGKWNDIPASIGLAMRLHLASQRAVLAALKAYDACQRERAAGAPETVGLDILLPRPRACDPVGEAATVLVGPVVATTGIRFDVKIADDAGIDPLAGAVEAGTRDE